LRNTISSSSNYNEDCNIDTITPIKSKEDNMSEKNKKQNSVSKSLSQSTEQELDSGVNSISSSPRRTSLKEIDDTSD
jgi:hypothetical protein